MWRATPALAPARTRSAAAGVAFKKIRAEKSGEHFSNSDILSDCRLDCHALGTRERVRRLVRAELCSLELHCGILEHAFFSPAVSRRSGRSRIRRQVQISDPRDRVLRWALCRGFGLDRLSRHADARGPGAR